MATKTYKLEETTIDSLNQICNELGLTWDGTFNMLANLYIQEKAISVVPERKGELQQFQALMNQLGEQYANTLAMNASTAERIKQEYKKRESEQLARIEHLNKITEQSAKVLDARRIEIENKDKEIALLKEEIESLKKQLADNKELVEIRKQIELLMTSNNQK